MSILKEKWFLEVSSITIVVATAIYLYFTWTFDHWKKRGIIAMEPWPILGNFQNWALLRKDIAGKFKEMYQWGKGHDFIGIWVFRRPSILVISPKFVENVLMKDFDHFADRSCKIDKRNDPLAGESLFFVENSRWQVLRKKLVDLFSEKKLGEVVGVMDNIAEVDLVSCIKNNGEKPTELCEMSGMFTNEVIARTVLGQKASALENPDSEYNNMRRRYFGVRGVRAFKLMSLWFMQGVAKIWGSKVYDPTFTRWLRKIFNKAAEERQNSKEVHSDMLATLMSLKDEHKANDGINFNGDSLEAQVAGFFRAGNEAVSRVLAFLLYELALQPKLQHQLAAEVKATLDKCKGKLTYDIVNEMTYLEMCVKEILRMYPPLVFLDRECTKTYSVPGSKRVIEKGTILYIPVAALQTDSQYFKDPMRFSPDRFSKEEAATILPFTYLPFGDGPRQCIGAHYGTIMIKLAVIHILQHFTAYKCPQTEVPLSWEVLTMSPTPKDGIQVQFIPVE